MTSKDNRGTTMKRGVEEDGNDGDWDGDSGDDGDATEGDVGTEGTEGAGALEYNKVGDIVTSVV